MAQTRCGVAGCERHANMISWCAVCHKPLCDEHVANSETAEPGDEIACPEHVAEVEKCNAEWRALLQAKMSL